MKMLFQHPTTNELLQHLETDVVDERLEFKTEAVLDKYVFSLVPNPNQSCRTEVSDRIDLQ
jgi:hypothetical protein